MADTRWDKQWETFHAALERPAQERAAFVKAQLADDPDLASEVLKLLEASSASEDLLREPAIVKAGALDFLEPESLINTTIGPYRLTAVLGEGGMGVVYAADQAEPVRRKVALKIIRLGMNTEEVVRRFEMERQALALMSHPNIARVFDAGVTADGRPYFVMEYVVGMPLTEYCDDRRLSIGKRLELFCEVCAAIQHAHQKGVIHRDIKPSNVIVEIGEDGRATPKVIDFGIAKAINQQLTEKTLATKLGRIMGTPAYMSPEQADLDGERVDTRSDIYSLSVLLYELLTSTTPFTQAELLSAGYAEINRVIREEDPPPPSTRLSRMEMHTARSVAESRSSSAQSVQQQVAGDLDWIILKGLEKSPDRRYSSAAELQADIRRHLNDEPVVARPPSRGYKLAKFYRRNRLATNAAIVILGLGIAFTVTTTLQSRSLARALEQATVERTRAQEVTAFILKLLAEADPAVSGAESVTVREVLDRGAAELESSLKGQPATKAATIFGIANVYRELGLYEDAIHVLDLAASIEPDVQEQSPVLLGRLRLERAYIEHDLGHLPTAETLYREAAGLMAGSGQSGNLVDVWGGLGQVLAEMGKAEEGRSYIEDALKIATEADDVDKVTVARLTNHLTEALLALGAYDRAAESAQRAVALSNETFGETSTQAAMAYATQSIVNKRLGRFEDALTAETAALDIYQRLMGRDHLYSATLLSNRAATLTNLGRLDEAERDSLESLAIYGRLFETAHPGYVSAQSNLANIYVKQGKYAAAETAFRRVLDLDRQSLGSSHPYIASDMESIATTLSFQGRSAAALALQSQVVDMRREVLPAGHPDIARGLLNYSKYLIETRRPADAQAALDQALTMLAGSGEQDPLLLAARFARAELLFLRGDLAGADEQFGAVQESQGRSLGPDHPDLATTLLQRARVKAALGEKGESERMLRRSLEIRRASLGRDHPLTKLAERELKALQDAAEAPGGA